MTDDKQPQNQKNSDLFLQDELDVYEAILKLEERFGKRILTKEQRESLQKAGRVLGGIIGEEDGERSRRGESLEEATNRKSTGGDKLANVGSDDLLIYALEEAMVQVLIEQGYYTREQWDKKSRELKVALLKVYFFALLGLELDSWVLKVRKKARG